MKGVTGGSLPVEIWRSFVSAATPLLDQGPPRFELSRAESQDPPSPSSENDARCDHSACAAAYRSFRSSDCTYQSYGGARKVCQKGAARDIGMAEYRSRRGDRTRRDGRRMLAQDRASEQSPELLDNIEADGAEPVAAAPLRIPKRPSAGPAPNDETRSRSWPHTSGEGADKP
jgi:hypothetical protein